MKLKSIFEFFELYYFFYIMFAYATLKKWYKRSKKILIFVVFHEILLTQLFQSFD